MAEFSLSKRLPPTEVVEGIAYANVYWTVGPAPKDMAPSEVSDPPNCGWGTCFVFDDGGPTVKLLSPWHLKSWVVTRQSYEFLSLRGPLEGFHETVRQRYVERFAVYYAAHKLREWESDFELAERIMRAIGVPVPETEAEWRRLAPGVWRDAEDVGDYARNPDGAQGLRIGGRGPKPKPSGGKAPEATGGLKKPVKRAGRKGEILAAVLGGQGSAAALEKQFGISRSNLLSQLFLLRKEHNIGYTANGDAVAVQLPEGCDDPFAAE